MAPVNSKTSKFNKFANHKKDMYKNSKYKRYMVTGINREKDEIDKTKLAKYDRGLPPDSNMIKVKMEQKKMAQREEKIKFGLSQSVRSEILLTEEGGYLEAEKGEVVSQFRQRDIQDAVDLVSVTKRFDLNLRDFGPYRMNYSRNGRFLLLGGRKGHVAAVDWIRKKLLCEINVMDSVYDVTWLHQETLYAVAQKKWVYIYDNEGIEIHCIKKLHKVIKMMFLPYHFLLATVGETNIISWLDVSIGQMVQQFHLKGRRNASAVAQHPGNAMICVGEPTGVVSFWSPNSKNPAVTRWCHKSPVCAVAFDPKGVNFTTAGVDRTIKLWDARNLNGPMQHYRLRSAPNCMSMSHRGTLGVGLGNLIEIYNDKIDLEKAPEKYVYLRHRVPGTISNIEFCPFEDVLGIAHGGGFASMLVPGCGEPNFDALEVNPFQTKSQRREAEVKALLGKIPSDLITWDTTELRKVDIPSLEEIIEAKKQTAHIKPPDIQFAPRNRKGKKSGSAKAAQRKKIMKEEFRRTYVREMKSLKSNEGQESSVSHSPKSNKKFSVLDRFKARTKN